MFFIIILNIGRARSLISMLGVLNGHAEKLEMAVLKFVVFLKIITFPYVSSHLTLISRCFLLIILLE